MKPHRTKHTDAEDWFWKRNAEPVPDAIGGAILDCPNGQFGPFSSRTVVRGVIVDGKTYPIKPPAFLRPMVKYVVDIVNGRAWLQVDISLRANWDDHETAMRVERFLDKK